MINIFVSIEVSVDKKNQMLPLLEALTTASQKENGCSRYQYWLHPTDPEKIAIVEQWMDAASLEKHEATEHFNVLLPQIQALANQLDIEKF